VGSFAPTLLIPFWQAQETSFLFFAFFFSLWPEEFRIRLPPFPQGRRHIGLIFPLVTPPLGVQPCFSIFYLLLFSGIKKEKLLVFLPLEAPLWFY